MPKYDSKIIEGHYDEYGLKERDRLVTTPKGKVQFHIHMHYLQKYIKRDNRILEIGPGPGRFTIELAKLGAEIGIVDISKVQLRLNEEKVREAGCEDSVLWRKQMDVVDLEAIEDDSFDATLCFGGPLSYVFDEVHQAIDEMLRVTEKDGVVLTSIMSCLGTYLFHTRGVFEAVDELGIELLDETTRTGDVVGKLAAGGTNLCHMFRWSEFRDILSEHPVEILETSAANFLSSIQENQEYLSGIMNDSEKWQTFLNWELDFAKEPGAIDISTHMIVIFRNKKS